jgi:hypothetical protein
MIIGPSPKIYEVRDILTVDARTAPANFTSMTDPPRGRRQS